MTIEMPSGTTVQKISSGTEPSICVAIGFFSLRYLMEKVSTMAKTSAVKKMVTSTRNPYRASTCGAIVEAWSGNNGKYWENILLEFKRSVLRDLRSWPNDLHS